MAKVGGETIDRHEFLMRYESAVWIGENRRAMMGPAKHAFLLSMIAEKLLANEAVERGVDRDPGITRILNEIERMLLMDALYRREMKHGISFTDEEIDRAAHLSRQEVTFRFAVFGDERTASEAAASVASESRPDSPSFETDVATLPWGEIYPPLEILLFEELQAGEWSRPVEVDGAWYVVQLINRRFPVAQSAGELAEARQRASDILRHRKEKARFHTFMNDFGAGKTAGIDPDLFAVLANAISHHYDERAARRGSSEARYPLRFLESDFAAIRLQFDDFLARDFILADDFSRTFGYVIDRLSLKGFSLERPGQRVDAALRAAVWEMIAEEFLIEEARARGLDRGPGFWRDMEMWRTAYLSKGLRKVVVDSLRRAADNDLWEVNVRMLEVATVEEAEAVKHRIRSGEDMAELVRAHSIGRALAQTGGETGYRMVSDFGDLAELLRTLEIDELAGPVFTDPNFTILQLLDRRRPEAIESQLESLADHALNELVARLAQEQGVHIDLDALEAIQVSQLNVLLVRFLGFGNRLLAVPTLPRALDWIDHLKRDEVYVAL